MEVPHHFERREKLSAVKLHASQYIIAGVLLVLAIGLWRLQVLGASEYRVLAMQNRIRKMPVLAPRGKIFDRNGNIIVDNYPSVSCYLLREQVKNLDADLPMIANGLHMTVEDIQAILKRYAYEPKYKPLPLKQDITQDEQAFIEAHRDELPELETQDEQRRLYPKDGFAAHLIGYVGEVSQNDLNSDKFKFYSPGDVVGKSGVEAAYDAALRGTDGSRNVIVNSHGKEVGLLGQDLAVPGQDLRLTIDLDLQRVVERLIDGKNGAIVAMDPHTGEILAMASRPTYDPNQFLHLSRTYWNTIVNDQEHPMMNKAIQAQLAPGSTFKIIMSVAGLQEGIAQDMHVMCSGGVDFYGHFFKCDAKHGMVDIHRAIPVSCDSFYYTLANKLGIDTMAKYAKSVGISQRTGIDLPDEATGVMPSTLWKLKTQHDKWYAGETISVGIGQGAIQASPIQLARALSGIASGGALQRPHVVMPGQVSSEIQQAIDSTFTGSGKTNIPLAPENWQTITDAMSQTTIIGTAARSHMEGIDFAGKTGTAQVMSHDALARSGGGHKTMPNSWFVGMAPRRNPDIVVAVLWENGDQGANSAKLAAQVINAFVEKQRKAAGNLVHIAEKPKATDSTVKPSETAAKPAAPPQGQ